MWRWYKACAGLWCAVALAACATREPALDPARDASAVLPQSQWTHQPFPGKKATEYSFMAKEGRQAVKAWADMSASALRQDVNIAPEAIGRLGFSWNVPALIRQADLAHRESDDSPVRIILAFDGDRSSFSPRDAMLSELARMLTGEPLPYATLMYVWCNRREPGSVIVDPRTDRIRKIVVESGSTHLGRWMDYERDVRADYERVFGEPPGALVGVALMTDADNTRSQASAWYGPVRWLPASVAGR